MDPNAPIRYSDLIQPDDSIKNLQEQLRDLAEEYKIVMDGIKAQAESVKKSLSSISGATTQGQQAIKDASAIMDKLAKKELEKCIGVDSGIISNPPDTNYQNVDSVRKSTRNTQAFIERARDEADRLIDQMVYAWDMLLNFHGQPTGTYTHTHDWSDDYIESMSDTRDSIVAGYSIGATDAFDFRTRVLGESPEIAKLRLEEIKSGRVGIIGEE